MEKRSEQTQKDQNHKVLKDEWMGPHGLGDPYSTSLRTVETEVLIPKLMREKARTEKCVDQVKDFNECATRHKYLAFQICKPESRKMFDCFEKWYHDEDFKKECAREYLLKRKEYRLTGKSEKMQRVKS